MPLFATFLWMGIFSCMHAMVHSHTCMQWWIPVRACNGAYVTFGIIEKWSLAPPGTIVSKLYNSIHNSRLLYFIRLLVAVLRILLCANPVAKSLENPLLKFLQHPLVECGSMKSPNLFMYFNLHQLLYGSGKTMLNMHGLYWYWLFFQVAMIWLVQGKNRIFKIENINEECVVRTLCHGFF